MALLQTPTAERRNAASREDLLRRVSAEFAEMPCLCLTARQAQRLFGLRSDVCDRVLMSLVKRGALTRGADDQYRLRQRLDPPVFAGMLDDFDVPSRGRASGLGRR